MSRESFIIVSHSESYFAFLSQERYCNEPKNSSQIKFFPQTTDWIDND